MIGAPSNMLSRHRYLCITADRFAGPCPVGGSSYSQMSDPLSFVLTLAQFLETGSMVDAARLLAVWLFLGSSSRFASAAV